MRCKISPYVFIRGAQAKTMLELSRDLLLPSASFHQFFIMSRRSGHPTKSRQLEGRVVVFYIIKLTGPRLISFKKLPLSVIIIIVVVFFYTLLITLDKIKRFFCISLHLVKTIMHTSEFSFYVFIRKYTLELHLVTHYEHYLKKL